jgi:hypothetical protein
MGLFLSTTAVRDVAVDELIGPIESWRSDHFVACSVAGGNDLAPHRDRVDAFTPIDGWTLVQLARLLLVLRRGWSAPVRHAVHDRVRRQRLRQ